MDNLEKLEIENEQLKRRIRSLENILFIQKQGIKWSSAVMYLILLGPSLALSIRNYLSEIAEQGFATLETKSNLISAVIRRAMYVGIVGALVALAPIVLLIWQNLELRNQTEKLGEQMLMTQQLEMSKVLFGEARQKQEIFNQWLKQVDISKGLTGIDIDNTFLDGINLSGADLRKSLINYVSFKKSNLESAKFSKSSLVATDFRGANLKNAKFIETDLTLARFQNADLSNTDFSGSILNSANFSGAKVKGAVFKGACFDQSEDAFENETLNSYAKGDLGPIEPEKHGIKLSCEGILVGPLSHPAN